MQLDGGSEMDPTMSMLDAMKLFYPQDIEFASDESCRILDKRSALSVAESERSVKSRVTVIGMESGLDEHDDLVQEISHQRHDRALRILKDQGKHHKILINDIRVHGRALGREWNGPEWLQKVCPPFYFQAASK